LRAEAAHDRRLDVGARSAVAVEARLDQTCGMGFAKARRRLGGDGGKASLAPPIDTEPNRHLKPLQALQAQPAERGFDLPSEVMGVVLPALDDDSRPGIGGQ